MNIIITGAGAVGYHLAKMLSSESQNIYLIDENEERLNYVASHLDVFSIAGDAKSITVLEEAKVNNCDLLIAVTSSEETNLLVSILAKKHGAKRTIARISDMDIIKNNRESVYQDLGIDTLISPVLLATEEIRRLIQRSVFTDHCIFEDGQLSVFGISIGEDSPLVNMSIQDGSYLNPNLNFKSIAIHRNEETLLTKRGTVIKQNDIVYFIAKPEAIDNITKICGKENFPIRDIMILGGSRIGMLTAELLENDYNVILIEKDKAKCEKMAGKLKKALVVNLNAQDVTALEDEGLADMDAFIAVTGDSESNIMSSLVAKNHGVKKTIARVENIDYIHLSQAIGIDTLINKKIIAASDIFKYVRKGDVSAIANLHGVDAEIIEFVVHEDAKVTHRQIKDLNFPIGVNVAGVVREDKAYIPFGDFELKAGDKAIVFCLTKEIHKIEKYFS